MPFDRSKTMDRLTKKNCKSILISQEHVRICKFDNSRNQKYRVAKLVYCIVVISLLSKFCFLMCGGVLLQERQNKDSVSDWNKHEFFTLQIFDFANFGTFRVTIRLKTGHQHWGYCCPDAKAPDHNIHNTEYVFTVLDQVYTKISRKRIQ